MKHLECIRGIVAQKIGIVENWEDAKIKSISIPKISIISKAQNYIDMDGNNIRDCDMDICVRAISVGKLHKAYPITVSIATGAAIKLNDTIVNELIKPAADKDIFLLGHASGVTPVDIKMDNNSIIKGGVRRRARRIMEGFIYVKD